MASIVKRIDLRATLMKLTPGESVDISYRYATETAVKTAVTRFNQKHNTDLRTTSKVGVAYITVRRVS